MVEAHRGDQLRPLEKMPGVKRNRKKPSDDAEEPEEFAIKLPNGRVFSYRAFEIAAEVTLASHDSDSQELVVKRANDLPYGIIKHQRGVLHGLSLAAYENKADMIYVNFQNGKRHGILKSFHEDGSLALFSQYTRGNRDGFTCFCEDKGLVLIVDYKLNQPKWIQRMNKDKKLEGFDSLDKAKKHPATAALLKKMDAFDDKLRKEELEFRKQARKAEEQERQATASLLGPEKRRRIQQRHNEHAAANAAFLQEMARRARGQ